MNRSPRHLAFFLVFALMASQGCAVQGPNPKSHLSAASVNYQSNAKRCADRVDAARAGGLAGTVWGTLLGSTLGMPFLGIFYRVAGYALGFATGNSCRNVEQPEKGSKLEKRKIQGNVEKPITPQSQPIKEETL